MFMYTHISGIHVHVYTLNIFLLNVPLCDANFFYIVILNPKQFTLLMTVTEKIVSDWM